MRPDLSIVIPALNEAAGIEATLRAQQGPGGGACWCRFDVRIEGRFLQQFVATQATPPHASQPAQTLNALAEVSARHSGETQ